MCQQNSIKSPKSSGGSPRLVSPQRRRITSRTYFILFFSSSPKLSNLTAAKASRLTTATTRSGKSWTTRNKDSQPRASSPFPNAKAPPFGSYFGASPRGVAPACPAAVSDRCWIEQRGSISDQRESHFHQCEEEVLDSLPKQPTRRPPK